LRKETRLKEQTQSAFPIAWKWDKSKYTPINFKGYQSGYRTSEVSGLPRLYYNRSKPYDLKVPFYNTYVDTLSIQRPIAYVIPQGWWKVIERLQMNNINMTRLKKDTSIEVESYRIESYQSSPRPYESHHPNNNTRLTKNTLSKSFRKGDYLIFLNQKGNRFLMETLEPQAEDSYFSWNFFDAILGQKEGYSDYVFEETAAAYLKSHPQLLEKLKSRQASDSSFRKNAGAQLDFVFRNSPYYEPAHMQYPVYRIIAK
jgi:hypothetical protein